ncbi:MAG: tRNA pseudouridine(38-40) synthase TruA [Desulfobulbaceae bacterium]|uniref:tRNA pseudouridine synthase A n=1 Tax=Candidatus Desulfobia pelagia TaxID=2841692 RepID=A0A8J6NF98_9BACT|nr:tRNA pseudouridine(38-40) synthase TruA [Candidatus Desulfobia pelagia]
MRNIKLTISYDGTEFAGWQRQPDAVTIQGEIEKKLKVMTSEDNLVHGAGRTDAGVHAFAMSAHFGTASAIPVDAFNRGLNSLLPASIRIIHVEEVASSFHARIDASVKVYRYCFTTAKICIPTRRLYCTHCPGMHSFEQIRQALSLVRGVHDFSSFEAVGSRDLTRDGGRGAVREIFYTAFNCLDENNSEWYIDIGGDGFLRKMVRNIVGTLFEVGYDRLSVNGFATVLKAEDRSLAGPTAPACGLFLKKVYYEKPSDIASFSL